MPDRTILEFFVHFIVHPRLRDRVLYQEITGMVEFGLSNPTAVNLARLDQASIVAAMVDELQGMPKPDLERVIGKMLLEMGIDLDYARGVIHEGEPHTRPAAPRAVTTAVGAAVYAEGSVHIRSAEALQDATGVRITIELVGQGFGPGVKITLTQGQAHIPARVIERRSDVDLFQRLKVEVTLTNAGEWMILAQNPGDTRPSDPYAIEIGN